jgi:hypothetical protein
VTYLISDPTLSQWDANCWTDADERLLWSMRPRPSFAETVWLWPATGFAGLNNNPGVDNVGNVGPRIEYARDVRWSGSHPPKTISGITRDNTGTPLPGVTVKAYRTSADAPNALPADLQEGPAVVSAADGAYTICVPNTDPHYLDGYLAGSPDVAGTTLNTLVGI